MFKRSNKVHIYPLLLAFYSLFIGSYFLLNFLHLGRVIDGYQSALQQDIKDRVNLLQIVMENTSPTERLTFFQSIFLEGKTANIHLEGVVIGTDRCADILSVFSGETQHRPMGTMSLHPNFRKRPLIRVAEGTIRQWIQQTLSTQTTQVFITKQPDDVYLALPIVSPPTFLQQAPYASEVALLHYNSSAALAQWLHTQKQQFWWTFWGAIALLGGIDQGLRWLILRPMQQAEAVPDAGHQEVRRSANSPCWEGDPIAASDNQLLHLSTSQPAPLHHPNAPLATRLAEHTAHLQTGKEQWQLAWQGADDDLWDWNIQSMSMVGSHSEITAQQQLEMQLTYRVASEASVNRLIHRTWKNLDLLTVLEAAVEEGRQFLKADRMVILQYESPYRCKALVESLAASYESLCDTILFDPMLANYGRFANGQNPAIAIADLEQGNLPENHVELMRMFQVKAYLVVPILQGETSWGFVMVHQCQHTRTWDELEIAYCQDLVAQLAIAIHQAELYDQVQRLNMELEAQVQAQTAQLREALEFEALLKRITDRVRDSLDEEQIIQSAVQELAMGVEAGACVASAYDFKAQTVIPRYEYTPFFSPTRRKVMPLHPNSPIHQHLLRGDCLQFCEYHLTWGRVSLLLSPIRDDQGLLGSLCLYTFANKTFDELQVRVVQQVANQCAIAIRQARLYEASQQQVRELERLNQLKDDFLSTVSHELRTPMANIKMALQMVEILANQSNLPDKLMQQMQKYLRVLEAESSREMGMINDLLDLSRLDAGTEPILPTNIDFRTWLAHVTEPFTERARTQQHQLTLELDDSVHCVPVDLTQTELILAELLNNACKYTPPGGTIIVAAAASPTTLSLSVINSGIEIPPAEYDNIFEKFYRIPNNDPWRHGGTGLGLALVKKRVVYLGGTIAVSSAQGETRFTVHLPLHHDSLLTLASSQSLWNHHPMPFR